MNYQIKAINKTKQYSHYIRFIPWVKSIVIINSVASGECNANSDIDLMFIVSPRRLYLSKFMIRAMLIALGQLETQKSSAQKFSLGTFIDTNGVDWQKHGMLINKDKFYQWINSYIFISGEQYRHLMDLGQANKGKIKQENSLRIPALSLVLDYLDQWAQLIHYRHTLSQNKNWQNNSFIRLEHNIISLHALDHSTI